VSENHRSDHLIELPGVVKSYPVAGGEFTALHETSLHIDAAQYMAVVGKSGSG
jgi:putative ABC transport system ATP-binding protein